MIYHLPFKENLYRKQMSLVFDAAWSKNLEKNKINFLLCTLLLIVSILFLFFLEQDFFTNLLLFFSIFYMFFCIEYFIKYKKKKKKYLQLVEDEIVDNLTADQPHIFEINTEFIQWKSHKYDIKVYWKAIEKVSKIEDILLFSFTSGNIAFVLSEEEVGENDFHEIINIIQHKSKLIS